MGDRGPAPKRITERLGHVTKAQKAGTSIVQITGEVTAPPLSKGTHRLARLWYNSLKASGQAQFFEPSDWAAARFIAEAMTITLASFSAASFTAVFNAMESMLSTERSRRRARLEVERNPGEPEKPVGVTALEEYRKVLNA